MKLRKINAVFSLITTGLLLGHAISLGAWMLSKGSIAQAPSSIPHALTTVALVHAIISIVLLISTHKGRKNTKIKHYPKLNAAMAAQRISGVLLIIFTWLHIAGTMGITQTPPMVHAIVPPLFFTLTLAHVAVSTSKAFITLGIGDAEFVKRVDVVIKVICVATLLADVIGFYLFVV